MDITFNEKSLKLRYFEEVEVFGNAELNIALVQAIIALKLLW